MAARTKLTRLLLCSSTLATILFSGCATSTSQQTALPAANRESAGFKTDFVPQAVLTPEEQKTVVALALQCGIPRPSLVYTYRFVPGGGYGIAVKSEEVIAGRMISFNTVPVY